MCVWFLVDKGASFTDLQYRCVCQLPRFLQSTEMQQINLVPALPPCSPLQHINSWPAGQTKSIELGTHSSWSMRAGAGLLIVVIPNASLNLKTKGKSNMDQPPLSLVLSYFLSVDVGQPWKSNLVCLVSAVALLKSSSAETSIWGGNAVRKHDQSGGHTGFKQTSIQTY